MPPCPVQCGRIIVFPLLPHFQSRHCLLLPQMQTVGVPLLPQPQACCCPASTILPMLLSTSLTVPSHYPTPTHHDSRGIGVSGTTSQKIWSPSRTRLLKIVSSSSVSSAPITYRAKAATAGSIQTFSVYRLILDPCGAMQTLSSHFSDY